MIDMPPEGSSSKTRVKYSPTVLRKVFEEEVVVSCVVREEEG